MKNSILIAAFVCICAFAHAQDNTKQENKNAPQTEKTASYCMGSKGDVLVLMKDGKQVYNDIKLDDGTRISTNGRIIKPDGTEHLLKENECADLDGEILKPAKAGSIKKSEE